MHFLCRNFLTFDPAGALAPCPRHRLDAYVAASLRLEQLSHYVPGLADDRARFAGLKAAADEAEQQLAQRGARGSDFDRDKFERMYALL